MKNCAYIITLVLGLIVWACPAQVQFKIELLDDNTTYQVSMLPLATWSAPDNLTSTAQITLKVPTGQFRLTNFQNLQPGIVWERNTHVIAPVEAPDYDYFSFVLVDFGTAGLDYITGQEVPLFSFQNGAGCPGMIAIFDNENDPFRTPNSRQTNVGNHITTFGAKGDAYVGWVGSGQVDCTTTDVEEPAVMVQGVQLYPNPATAYAEIVCLWPNETQKCRIGLYDVNGRLVLSEDQMLSRGNNQYKITLDDLADGVYDVYLEGNGWNQLIQPLVVVSQ